MRHVSEPEKKPDSASSPTSAANSQPNGMLSVMRGAAFSAALQDQLEHDLAADVGEQQHREPGERPVDGGAPAPAAEIGADEQPAEDEPRKDREDDLAGEGERLAEELLGEEDPAHAGNPQQHHRHDEAAKH